MTKTIMKVSGGGAHLNPSTQKQRQADLCEFKANLAYRVSSGTARATKTNPVSKKSNGKRKTKNKSSNNKLGVGGPHL
ncbi:hypothetical protein I79_005144 [Cricetulus griseus]|uniref:Uncharacterized protein n=1 Tax=Cricetulus griseus TaxID=10029 RepID=G3H4E4_CRIGR|nr:hypothetical protein I79_005144 [Cricetulus griseus]